MTIYGLILSEPRYETFRKSETPVREIYLDNDHRVHYLVGERTKGVFLSGLTLSASLSLNPTGSPAAPYTLGASEFASGSFFTSSISESTYIDTATHSYFWETHASQSFYVQAVTTGTLLQVELIEDPPASSEYIGIFNGADITTAFTTLIEDSASLNLSQSYQNYTSSYSGSDLETVIVYVTHSVIDYVTSSVQSPIPDAAPRQPGVYEIITSGSHLKVSTPLILRSVRSAG